MNCLKVYLIILFWGFSSGCCSILPNEGRLKSSFINAGLNNHSAMPYAKDYELKQRQHNHGINPTRNVVNPIMVNNLKTMLKGIPGQEILLPIRFLFSNESSKLSLRKELIEEILLHRIKDKPVVLLRKIFVVLVSSLTTYGLSRMLLMAKAFFEMQQTKLQMQEKELFGEYESPDATIKAYN